MKARRKGSDDAFREISHLSFKGSSLTYCADAFEFEQEQEPIGHWQDVRERAAIAVLPQCIEIAKELLLSGKVIKEENIAPQVVAMCVDYADALVKKLKGE